MASRKLPNITGLKTLGPPGEGYRRWAEGQDTNVEPFEERLRKEGVVPQGSLDRFPWLQLLPPRIDWFHRAALQQGSNMAATDTQVLILAVPVPKGQTLVVLEFTPLLLRDDPGLSGTYLEMEPYRYFGRILYDIRIAGSDAVRTATTVNANDAVAAVVVATIYPGISVVNRRAYTSDPTYPMAFYVGATQILSVTARFVDTAGAAQQLQNIPGAGASMAFGAIINGYFISNAEKDKVMKG